MTRRSRSKVQAVPDSRALALFAACALATLSISTATPLAALGYAAAIFSLGLWILGTQELPRIDPRFSIPLAAIAVWGFVQLAFSYSEARWETFLAALRFASYGATAWCAAALFTRSERREPVLICFAWFASVIAVLAVLAYYTSESRVLWLLPSPYPDVWGPFLSRNNFAQFLELALPVALWLGIRPQGSRVYLVLAAVLLAAGIASASRAGAILLAIEGVAVFWMSNTTERKRWYWFATALALCIAVVGVSTLAGRFIAADPFAERREIFSSAWRMTLARPLTGWGLGTFGTVYPEFAEYDTGLNVDHAHNDWLEWSAEGGILFVALWAAWAFPLCYRALRSIWGMGIAVVFVHALVDYPFARPGVAGWLFVLAGAVEAARKRRHRPAGGHLAISRGNAAAAELVRS